MQHTRKVLITAGGLGLLLIGAFLMLPLVPGPGILVFILGVALLAREYDWAKRLLIWIKQKINKI